MPVAPRRAPLLGPLRALGRSAALGPLRGPCSRPPSASPPPARPCALPAAAPLGPPLPLARRGLRPFGPCLAGAPPRGRRWGRGKPRPFVAPRSPPRGERTKDRPCLLFSGRGGHATAPTAPLPSPPLAKGRGGRAVPARFSRRRRKRCALSPAARACCSRVCDALPAAATGPIDMSAGPRSQAIQNRQPAADAHSAPACPNLVPIRTVLTSFRKTFKKFRKTTFLHHNVGVSPPKSSHNTN